MLKYKETQIVFQEVPDEVSLAINISNCPCKCKGCHSPYLAEDEGTELNNIELDSLIEENEYVTCIAFMGGDSSPREVNALAKFIKQRYKDKYKIAWYSGRQAVAPEIDYDYFDYIKIGPYIPEKGALDSPTTNQVFMQITKRKEKEFKVKMLTKRFLRDED